MHQHQLVGDKKEGRETRADVVEKDFGFCAASGENPEDGGDDGCYDEELRGVGDVASFA